MSSCRLLVETKTERKGVRADQLRRHLARLDAYKETTRALILLTPDDRCPAHVSEIADDRLVWASFSLFSNAIDELLADKSEVISERETLLLRELQIMFRQERLLETVKDTVVVAARKAWGEYQKYHAYVCQAGRSFEVVKFVAFYANGEVKEIVPAVIEEPLDVTFTPGLFQGRLGELVSQTLADGARDADAEYRVFLLSAPDAPETAKLGGVIQNDQTVANGKPTAFTMGHRYVNLSELRRIEELPLMERQTSRLG